MQRTAPIDKSKTLVRSEIYQQGDSAQLNQYKAMEAINQHEQLARFAYASVELLMYWDGATQDNKSRISYEFKSLKSKKVIASGNDFCTPQYPDSIDAVVTLLGFITIQPGDVDYDYFKKHTEDHMEWLRMPDCEVIRYNVSDYEDKESEYHKKAISFFKKHTAIL